MSVDIDRSRIFINGKRVEVWENPDVRFGCTEADLDSYISRGAWVLLFNAVTLIAPLPPRVEHAS
jgi:hypothetical protein